MISKSKDRNFTAQYQWYIHHASVSGGAWLLLWELTENHFTLVSWPTQLSTAFSAYPSPVIYVCLCVNLFHRLWQMLNFKFLWTDVIHDSNKLNAHNYDTVLVFIHSGYNQRWGCYYLLSPSAWVDQRSHQGDMVVINWLITTLSPCPETLYSLKTWCVKLLLITLFEVLHQIMQLHDTNANKLWFVCVGDKQVIPHPLVWYPCY